jgi:hypothetical protein
MPQERLIETLKQNIAKTNGDMFMVPRINIHPGCTQKWLDMYGFKINNCGWVNWPDLQTRIFKNTKEIRYVGKIHEHIEGFFKNIINIQSIQPNPDIALLHIKSVEKQESRWDSANGFAYVSPDTNDILKF